MAYTIATAIKKLKRRSRANRTLVLPPLNLELDVGPVEGCVRTILTNVSTSKTSSAVLG